MRLSHARHSNCRRRASIEIVQGPLSCPQRPASHQSPLPLHLYSLFRWLGAIKLGVHLSRCSPISSTSAGPLSTDDSTGSDSHFLMLGFPWVYWSCRRIDSWCRSERRELPVTMRRTHHRTNVLPLPLNPPPPLPILPYDSSRDTMYLGYFSRRY
jgi:hypothetical protein